jgi:chemotaxis protein histidine kinase CheA
VRNSLAHGLEAPAERRQAKKRPAGRMLIGCALADHSLVITLRDDGRGPDYVRIIQVAQKRGWIPRGMDPVATPSALLPLLTRPGFTTRAKASTTSGRGIGLDAVQTLIAGQGGTVALRDAKPGFEVKLQIPLKRAGIDAHVVERAGMAVAVPSELYSALVEKGELPTGTPGEASYFLFRLMDAAWALDARDGALAGRLAARIVNDQGALRFAPLFTG